MSLHEKKLIIAKQLIEQCLKSSIERLLFQPDLSRIKIQLRNGIFIFIQYNDFDEYGYSIVFSKIELDRCRFDNYDNRWDVSTRPHHFHPRYRTEAVSSKMIGEPAKDMPYLCDLIISGKITTL
ncbi:MAG: hypothetical protein JW891_09415 [Candidatus Lokiarchaeota archaeon]|nr:hypothetical protein [Candidatus Lokiarchaeota archaeon]